MEDRNVCAGSGRPPTGRGLFRNGVPASAGGPGNLWRAAAGGTNREPESTAAEKGISRRTPPTRERKSRVWRSSVEHRPTVIGCADPRQGGAR